MHKTLLSNYHVISQPAYSPDLAPYDFWIFGKFKRTSEKIKTKLKKFLKAMPKIDFKGDEIDLEK